MSDTWTHRTEPDGSIVAERDGYEAIAIIAKPGAGGLDFDHGHGGNCGHAHVGEVPWSALAPLIADAVARGALKLPAPETAVTVSISGDGGKTWDPPIPLRTPVVDAPSPTGTITTEGTASSWQSAVSTWRLDGAADPPPTSLTITDRHGNSETVTKGCGGCPMAIVGEWLGERAVECGAPGNGGVSMAEAMASHDGNGPAPALCPLRSGPLTVRLADAGNPPA